MRTCARFGGPGRPRCRSEAGSHQFLASSLEPGQDCAPALVILKGSGAHRLIGRSGHRWLEMPIYCPPVLTVLVWPLLGGALFTHLSNQVTISHSVCSVDSRAR